MQDSTASGSNPADAQGPEFALTDECQRPRFVFIFKTRRRETRPQSNSAEFLKQRFGQGPRELGAEVQVSVASCRWDPLAEIEGCGGTWIRLVG
jgi:hypothetical protein